ncbi:MAG: phage tail tape measure protein, partial [Bifidobacterium sp.]|nr:phage tail tape measure protein [Bifidobacterium sp.]
KFEAGFVKVGTMVGAVSAAVGVTAVKSFADFDAAMSEVGANVDATGNQLTLLREAALEAGKSTIYSATESAQAINELGKAGMSVADILSGGLTGALNLAASDGMDVAQAAEYMSSALAMFHLEGSRATDVADALAAGAGKALGEVSDFGEALNNCGAQAYSFGMSMEETVGTLALFAENGLVGADAGTQLNSMLMKLASPTKDAQAVMDKLGIAAYDAGGNFVGMAEFAGQLQKAEAGLTQEQRNQYNATMFGSYAIKGANYLYQAGEQGVRDWTDAVSESGYASGIAAQKTDNLKGDLERLGGSFEKMFLSFGEGANGPLRGVVQWVSDMVDAFASMPPQVQQVATVLGLLAGASAVLHGRFGELSDSSSKFKRNMGMLIDPVARAQTAFLQFADGIKLAFSSAETQMQTFGTAVSRSQAVMSGMKMVGSGVMNMLGGPFGIAVGVAGFALSAYAKKVQESEARTEEFESALKSTGDASETILNKIQDIRYGAWDRMMTGVSGLQEALDKAGISAAEFVLAVQGSEPHLDSVNEKITKLAHMETGRSQETARVISSDLKKLSGDYEKAVKNTEEYKQAISELGPQSGETSSKMSELTSATGEQAAAASEANDADQILADQFGATTDGVNDLASALSEVISALDTYYGFARSETDALLDLRSGYLDLEESVKKNGATLDTYTEKGIANRQALNNLAKSAVNAAKAQSKNGRSIEEINGTMNEAHDKFVQYAQAMGASAEEAEKMAEASGLGRDAAQKLIDAVKTANATPLESKTAEVRTDEAIAKLNDLMGKTTSLPNGKVIIYGDNSEAMNEIAQVVGAQIDPKTGQIIANKDQYDAMLALCNGATIDPHTGQLIGENNEYWKTLCITNGWKIDPKTGFIYGNNGHAIKAVNAVNNKNIADKWFNVTVRGADYAENQIGRLQQMTIGDKSFTVTTYYTSQGEKVYGGTIPKGNAMGGYISGPGTGTSDSILRRVSNGEYITNARSTAKYRRELEAINGGYYEQLKAAAGYASGGYVQATPAAPYVEARRAEAARNVFTQQITNNFASNNSPYVQAELTAAKLRMNTRTLLGASR